MERREQLSQELRELWEQGPDELDAEFDAACTALDEARRAVVPLQAEVQRLATDIRCRDTRRGHRKNQIKTELVRTAPQCILDAIEKLNEERLHPTVYKPLKVRAEAVDRLRGLALSVTENAAEQVAEVYDWVAEQDEQASKDWEERNTPAPRTQRTSTHVFT